MPKRFRTPRAKQGQLLVQFGQSEGEIDLLYCWPDNEVGMKRDSRLIMRALERVDIWEGRTLRQELQLRGYDITTLKFSIEKAEGDSVGK